MEPVRPLLSMMLCALLFKSAAVAYVMQHHSLKSNRHAPATGTNGWAICKGILHSSLDVREHCLQGHRTAIRAQRKHIDAGEGPEQGTTDTSMLALEFHQWFKDNGADTSLTLSYFGEIRGMMATRAIAKGEELLSYPRDVAMDMASLKGCPCADLVDETYWKSCAWFVQLGLWLLAEESKGAASAWAPYIASLPRTLWRPLDWTDSQLNMLAYQPLVDSIKKQRCEFSEILKETSPYLLSDTLRIERLEWAMRIALSRTFQSAAPKDASDKNRLFQQASWRSNKALVPALDLINHNSLASPKYSYDPLGDRFALVSETSYEPGQQVLNSYGEKSNDNLLLYYGFVEEDNPFDTFVLGDLYGWLQTSKSDEARCRDPHTRLYRLHCLNLTAPLKQAYLTKGTDEDEEVACVSGETMQALRAFLASDEDLKEVQGEAAMLGADMFKQPLSPESETAVLQILLEHVIHAQQLMPGSLKKDSDLLSGRRGNGGDLGQDERLAITFRREKRKVLACARERLETTIRERQAFF